MLNKIASGICAGILISIGGSVFLSCENKIVGALLFTVALLCICYKGYSLFTGKVGYLPEKADKEAFSVLLLGLLGNAIGTILCGFLLRVAIPAIGAAAETLCSGKLETQALWQTFVRAIFCGILMYLAVSIFRDSKTPLAILFCIPVFILSGFEHSIADMFYFSLAGTVFRAQSLLFLLLVVLGNSIGGLFIPFLQLLKGGRHG